ncbi:hypothetical protein GUITHDRAFT_110887 [Guillardia theta CCMP2712]|uniref:Uncharacterized protein n=1 Tax=Guillardia theta (strain CCMP2712) TaxID=905079 RepID=L1J4Z6_GUITC|nr:hypothetical protein GUITHDRAFT_110887 [Guillardia theta CCMP2712]EKX43160.1 hypothetical protein GUITHDRAFT_110887 [Guillardia theta CCMP2712]|eukprot:XP_005830140.1 hypothetical protein GUITHDRAFT_110887 [Guillardia theta CCMP2712]
MTTTGVLKASETMFDKLSRSELQKIAKMHGIKATQTNAKIIGELIAKGVQLEEQGEAGQTDAVEQLEQRGKQNKRGKKAAEMQEDNHVRGKVKNGEVAAQTDSSSPSSSSTTTTTTTSSSSSVTTITTSSSPSNYSEMSRSELQALAKSRGVKANQKTADIIANLIALDGETAPDAMSAPVVDAKKMNVEKEEAQAQQEREQEHEQQEHEQEQDDQHKTIVDNQEHVEDQEDGDTNMSAGKGEEEENCHQPEEAQYASYVSEQEQEDVEQQKQQDLDDGARGPSKSAAAAHEEEPVKSSKQGKKSLSMQRPVVKSVRASVCFKPAPKVAPSVPSRMSMKPVGVGMKRKAEGVEERQDGRPAEAGNGKGPQYKRYKGKLPPFEFNERSIFVKPVAKPASHRASVASAVVKPGQLDKSKNLQPLRAMNAPPLKMAAVKEEKKDKEGKAASSRATLSATLHPNKENMRDTAVRQKAAVPAEKSNKGVRRRESSGEVCLPEGLPVFIT